MSSSSSSCQHLSPKTRNWEPCVGPDNCDYRKQGLDVPHAYSQAEREAIDAERAGVAGNEMGGVSATEPDNSLSFSDGADPTITGTEELEFGNNLRNSYGVTQNDYKRDRIYDFVPNVPGMVVKVDTLDDGTRTMMVVSENHGFYADRALNLETGSVQFLRLRDNEPEVQIVDYPNTPEAMNAIEHSQVVRDSHFVQTRQNEIEEVIEDDFTTNSDYGVRDLDISTNRDDSALEVSGYKSGKSFDVKFNKDGSISTQGSVPEKIQQAIDRGEYDNLAKESASLSHKQTILSRRAIKSMRTKLPNYDSEDFNDLSPHDKQKELNREIKRLKSIDADYKKFTRSSVAKPLKAAFGSDDNGSQVKIGRDRGGFWVQKTDTSSGSPVVSTCRISDPRKNDSIVSQRNDKYGNMSDSDLSEIRKIPKEYIEELYRSHEEEVDEKKIRAMYKSF
jgi:hypothetical protein